MKSSKAQSAIELMILIGGVLFFFLLLTFIFQGKISKENNEKRNFAIQELAVTLENELSIAAKATDGYKRTFNIPQTVEGADYEITLFENFLYINTTDGRNAMGISVQNTTGQFKVGDTNIIRKQNSTILLN